MPFYKVPATASVASGNGPVATKHLMTYGFGHQLTVTAAEYEVSGDSSDRSGSSNLAEMTEADRDSELLRRDLEQRIQLSQGDQKRMFEVRQLDGDKRASTIGSNRRRTNDVIQEELLAQHRREEELASTRQLIYRNHQPSPCVVEGNQSPPSSSSISPLDLDACDKAAAFKYAHAGESRIVTELMEQRQRELELRGRWKEMGMVVPEAQSENETPFTLPEPLPVNQRKPSATRNGDMDERGDVETPGRRESSDNVASKVRPFDDPYAANDGHLPYIPANETPIEREIRLAREREDALREARGLQPLWDHTQGQEDRSVEISVTTPNGSHYHPGADSSVKVSMKKLASSRLQQELLKEKERELALKSQGAIHTTSEERAGKPVKYVEVISKHLADAPPPMPLKSPVPPSHPTAEAVKQVAEGKTVEQASVTGRTKLSLSRGPTPEHINELQTVFGGLQKQQPMTMLRQKSATTKPTIGERKILNELKEMQMREEELKSLRQSMQSSPRSDSFEEDTPPANRSQSPID